MPAPPPLCAILRQTGVTPCKLGLLYLVMNKQPLSNKLTVLLQALTPQERKRFKKWLLSPFHNEQTCLVELYDRLAANIKKEGAVTVSAHKLWDAIYAGKPYNDVRFRKLCSDLVQQTEAFLAYQEYAAQPHQSGINLLQTLVHRKLKPLYNQLLNHTQEQQNHTNAPNAEYFYEQYRLELMRHELKQGTGREDNRQIFHVALEHLDHYYLAEKLKHYCNLLNYQLVLHTPQIPEPQFMDTLLAYLHAQPENQLPPIIAVYLRITGTLTQPDDPTHYQHLKNLLAQYAPTFLHREAWTMYGYAQNYCIRQINAGNAVYLDELFQLYQDALQQQLLFTNGQLSPWHYKNIVVVALRLKAYQWAAGFIEAYKNSLPPKFAANAYTYNKAKLFFHQGQYGKVIELLREVTYDDVFYELDSKAMLLKTYYETDETDALLSLLLSFRIFLRRKKGISEHHRTNYLNLVRFTEKLLAHQPGNAHKLLQQLHKTKNVADANWLKEKLIAKK